MLVDRQTHTQRQMHRHTDKLFAILRSNTGAELSTAMTDNLVVMFRKPLTN